MLSRFRPPKFPETRANCARGANDENAKASDGARAYVSRDSWLATQGVGGGGAHSIAGSSAHTQTTRTLRAQRGVGAKKRSAPASNARTVSTFLEESHRGIDASLWRHLVRVMESGESY